MVSVKNEYDLKSADFIKCLFIDYILSHYTSSLLGTEVMYGTERRLVDLLIILNNETYAIEIKSESDNLNRLERQIKAYKMTFDYVYILTTESHLKDVRSIVEKKIGIFIINENMNIIRKRKAQKQAKKNIKEMLFTISEAFIKRGKFSYHPTNKKEIESILLAFWKKKLLDRNKIFLSERGTVTQIDDLTILSSPNIII